MIVMGLDLALSTGWAFGERGSQPHAGTFNLPGFSDRDLPRSMASIYSSVNALCKANGVKFVFIEAALRNIKRKNKRGILLPVSAHGTRCLTMLNGAAMAGAANSGAKVYPPVAPETWRKEVLGNGRPENPKAAALRYCALMKIPVPNDDAAEAVCIMQYGIGQTIGMTS